MDTKRLFVIGGERLFEEAFPKAQELFITRVRTTITGDRFFTPVIDLKWRFISQQGCVTQSTKNPGLRCDFQYWVRR